MCFRSGDEDFYVFIMNEQVYIQKPEGMLDEGIKKEHMSGQLIRQSKIWKLFKASYTKTSKITLVMTKWNQRPIN